MTKTTIKPLIVLALAVSLLTSCKKDTKKEITPEPEPTPTSQVPTTYNFTNADYDNVKQTISMFGEMVNYLKTTHTTTAATQPTLSAQALKNMYSNMSNPFNDANLNSSTVQLKSQTSTQFSFPTELESVFDDAQLASVNSALTPTTASASSGVAGKLISPSRAILVNANGFEYKEAAEKGLMGALLYYKAMTHLNNINTYDNVTIVGGLTAQEKAWDEAFGCFGVPTDFPATVTGLKYWGSYCNSVNSAIGSNATIMNGFLSGRAAITEKDNAARDAAKVAIIAAWEKVGAAKCISYFKGAKNNITDNATFHHTLSEANGFINAFKYNPSKTISNADINILQGYMGTNLYNISVANIDLAIAKLETAFNLNASIIP